MALRRLSAKLTRKKKDEHAGAPDFKNVAAEEEPKFDEELATANTDDPSVALVKQAALFGRARRRWFVLHRMHHKLAYYAKPFIPPEQGEIKGVIDIFTVSNVTCTGRKLEIEIAKGRRPYKLLADTPKVAADWVKLIKMQCALAARDNDLNRMADSVRQAAAEAEKAGDGGVDPGNDLYLEYGGFKLAASEDPANYLDYDPSLAEDGGGAAADADDDNGQLEDCGYLEQAAPQRGGATDGELEDMGYLDQQAPGGATVDADDYVPSPEQYGEHPDGDAADLEDAGYLAQAAADGDVAASAADDYVPDNTAEGGGEGAELEDAGYLAQAAPEADGAAAASAADDYVPEVAKPAAPARPPRPAAPTF